MRARLGADFQPRRVLDFGCGVGRLVLPLSRLCEEVVGVDVAEAMLSEAAANCRQAGATNVRLIRGDDRLSGVTGPFDFIHSFIVFQHVPVQRGLVLLERLLDLLAPDGVGALHFTYHCRRKPPLWKRLLARRCGSIVPFVPGSSLGRCR